MRSIILIMFITLCFGTAKAQSDCGGIYSGKFDWDMTIGQLVEFERCNNGVIYISAVGGWRGITSIKSYRDESEFEYFYSENGNMYYYTRSYTREDGKKEVEVFNEPKEQSND